MTLMDEIDKSVKKEKDRRNKIEQKAYFGGMFACFLMVVLYFAAVNAFDGNWLVWVFVGIGCSIISLPIYWVFSAILNIEADQQKWWHLPACLLAFGIIGLSVSGAWAG